MGVVRRVAAQVLVTLRFLQRWAGVRCSCGGARVCVRLLPSLACSPLCRPAPPTTPPSHAPTHPAHPTPPPMTPPLHPPAHPTSLDIVHCDLKPENILLRERGRMAVKASGGGGAGGG